MTLPCPVRSRRKSAPATAKAPKIPPARPPLLAGGRDRAADEPRVQRAEARRVTPEPGHDTGAEVVPDHVGDPDQVVEHLAPFGLRQVQRHALLVPVDGEEVRAP